MVVFRLTYILCTTSTFGRAMSLMRTLARRSSTAPGGAAITVLVGVALGARLCRLTRLEGYFSCTITTAFQKPAYQKNFLIDGHELD